MAADEVVRWSSVVGEYGVLLTEMGSLEDLRAPIKSYPRIKVGDICNILALCIEFVYFICMILRLYAVRLCGVIK